MTTRILARPDLQDIIVEAVSQGISPMTACRELGLSERGLQEIEWAATHDHWRRGKHDGNGANITPKTKAAAIAFMGRIDQAKAHKEAEAIRILHQAMLSKNEKTGIPEWRAALAYLKASPETRAQWFEHHPGDPAPRQTPAERLDGLPRAALIELAGEEWREILADDDPVAAAETVTAREVKTP